MPASFASSFGHDTPAHLQRRFAIRGVRCGNAWAALSAAPNVSRLVSSAEGVFGASIARRACQRDLINQFESGSCRNEALERHSEALHIGRCGGVPRGHERDVSNIRLVPGAVNGDPNLDHRVFADSSGAQAESTPAGRAGRTVGASAESVDAAEHRVKIHNAMGECSRSNQGERCDARSTVTSPASSPLTIGSES